MGSAECLPDPGGVGLFFRLILQHGPWLRGGSRNLCGELAALFSAGVLDLDDGDVGRFAIGHFAVVILPADADDAEMGAWDAVTLTDCDFLLLPVESPYFNRFGCDFLHHDREWGLMVVAHAQVLSQLVWGAGLAYNGFPCDKWKSAGWGG